MRRSVCVPLGGVVYNNTAGQSICICPGLQDTAHLCIYVCYHGIPVCAFESFSGCIKVDVACNRAYLIFVPCRPRILGSSFRAGRVRRTSTSSTTSRTLPDIGDSSTGHQTHVQTKVRDVLNWGCSILVLVSLLLCSWSLSTIPGIGNSPGNYVPDDGTQGVPMMEGFRRRYVGQRLAEHKGRRGSLSGMWPQLRLEEHLPCEILIQAPYRQAVTRNPFQTSVNTRPLFACIPTFVGWP